MFGMCFSTAMIAISMLVAKVEMPRTNSSSSTNQNRRRPNPSSSPGPPARRSRIIESTPSPGPIIPADQQLIENYLNNQLRLPANTNVTQAISANTTTTTTTNQRQVTQAISANTTSITTTNQRQVARTISANTTSTTTTTTTNTTNQRQMMPANNINEQQQQSQIRLEVAAEIALKRQQRLNSSQPEAARFINSIDSVSNLTNTDLFMIGWQKDNIFPELVGEVIFTHRGPTPKHGWDRVDCHVQIGREGEKETISIFSWKNYAERLQEAKLHDIVKFKNLLVVPETGPRQQWTGTVDIKFKFIASSKIEIIQRQQNNFIETGPSSSAVIYASQTGSGPAQDEEEDDVAYVG